MGEYSGRQPLMLLVSRLFRTQRDEQDNHQMNLIKKVALNNLGVLLSRRSSHPAGQ
jgi:hypothetical protein